MLNFGLISMFLFISLFLLSYCGSKAADKAGTGVLWADRVHFRHETALESLLSWVAGPFVDNVSMVESKDGSKSCFPIESGFISTVDATERLRECVPTTITFNVGTEFTRPVELRWAPFRGNMRLVRLGESGTSLYLEAGRPVVQYTSAGHLFLAMSEDIVISPSSHTQHLSQEFTELESAIDRIIGMYLVPVSSEGTNVLIDVTSRAMINLHNILLATRAYPECQPYISGDLTIEQSMGDPLVRSCFRRLLLTYWEHQRLSQVPVHVWAVPAIRALAQSGEPANRSPSSLWTLSLLSDALTTEAASWYVNNRAISTAEPPISLVFNQLESPTYYAPLPDTLLRRIVDEVHQLVAGWLGVSRDALEVTGSYGCREYRTGAVVRWHVDPVESQPLTAIIHLGDAGEHGEVGVNGEQGLSRAKWNLQIPKQQDTFIVGNLTTPSDNHANDNSVSPHNIDLQVGQVLLLQSAKLPHARVHPYTGEWYANAFVHLAPRGWADLAEVRALRD